MHPVAVAIRDDQQRAVLGEILRFLQQIDPRLEHGTSSSLHLHPPGDPARTFGVILDTSGSMDRQLLAKALGAISSYSLSRDVPYVRVVFCDAAPYDQGYLSPEDIAGRVQVKGRGGTVLQPGVDLLEKAEDFPKDGPLLIITDGYCDRVHVQREHAYLIPEGNHLPFVPRGEVFGIT